MREFFGFGGYTREPEGFLSWQHLLFVGTLLVLMALAAILLGNKMKDKDLKEKNKVLIWTAIAIDAFEIFKIVILCLRSGSAEPILYNLPLFLCSIQLIAIPLAAFAKGKIKESAIDFVCIFGLLGAVLGTIGAGNNYGTYPVLCLDNVVSGITHTISGFASLYIMISKMASMKKQNIHITFLILSIFCVLAYVANITVDYNYMFLRRGDGTPYDILYNLVGGNAAIYPALVIILFFVYIVIFYYLFYLFTHKKKSA